MFFTRSNLPKSKGLSFSDSVSLCQRQYRDDCDINRMIMRYLSGDTSCVRRGNFLDVSEAPDSLHDVQNITARAQSTWEGLPDSIKHAYGTPERFLAAVQAEESKRLQQVEKPAEKPVEKPAEKPVESVTSDGGGDK